MKQQKNELKKEFFINKFKWELMLVGKFKKYDKI